MESNMSLAGKMARIPVLGAVIIAGANIKFLFRGSFKGIFLHARVSDRQLEDVRVRLEEVSSRLDRVAGLEAALSALDERFSKQTEAFTVALRGLEDGRLHELEKAHLGLNHFVREDCYVRMDGLVDSMRDLSQKIQLQGNGERPDVCSHRLPDNAVTPEGKKNPHLSSENSKAISKDASESNRDGRFNRVADVLRSCANELGQLRKELTGFEAG